MFETRPKLRRNTPPSCLLLPPYNIGVFWQQIDMSFHILVVHEELTYCKLTGMQIRQRPQNACTVFDFVMAG